MPGERGAFEVSVNGQQIYSKKGTGAFPDLQALKESIQKFLK